jgi:hypothetical protein
MTAPTIGDLVARHNELLAYVEAEQAEYDTRMKPYTEAIVLLKGACLTILQEQGQQNAKTENGTAYQVTTMGVKVDNRNEFLKFIVDQQQWDMLQAGALKEPVKDWLDKHDGVKPPGVAIEFFTKCNIRRS